MSPVGAACQFAMKFKIWKKNFEKIRISNTAKKNDANSKSRHRSQKIGIENYLLFFSLETVSFLRPLLRRADRIRRPLAVAIRARKPCLFFLLLVEGWNVLFILFVIYSKNRTAKVIYNSKVPNKSIIYSKNSAI